MNRTITLAGVCVMLAMGASLADAQVGPNFDPDAWQYGPRGVADGEVPIWNPVMQKIKNGEPVIGGTIRATDPRTYCSTASAGYDFTWIEMQHEAMTWEQVARMWLACPRPAVPGVRIGHESEGNVQLAGGHGGPGHRGADSRLGGGGATRRRMDLLPADGTA